MARRTTLARNQSEHPARGHRDGQINFVCRSSAQGEIDWKKTSSTSTHINHVKFQFLYDFETSLLFHVYHRVASMPNTGVEEEYYRLRHFSITGKGIVNRGDSLKSRRSRSNLSVASSNSRWDCKYWKKKQLFCVPFSSEFLWLSLFRVAFSYSIHKSSLFAGMLNFLSSHLYYLSNNWMLTFSTIFSYISTFWEHHSEPLWNSSHCTFLYCISRRNFSSFSIFLPLHLSFCRDWFSRVRCDAIVLPCRETPRQRRKETGEKKNEILLFPP